MRKIITFFIIFFLSFAFSRAESIKNYNIKINLNRDSSLDIEENITYDFGQSQKHGIFRFIPLVFQVKGQEKWGGLLEREIKISDLRVLRNGGKEPIAELDEKDSNGNYFIKIGSPHKSYQGIQKYTIGYRVRGSLRYFEDFDEIYWNATGLDWPVIIEQARVELGSNLPELKFEKPSCYQGRLKSAEACQVTKEGGGKNIVFTSTRPLNPGEGLTVAASFKKGLVKKEEFWTLSSAGFWVGFLSLLAALIGAMVFYIRSFLNKYNPHKPVITVYYPYKNYHPALTGYLIDKKFDSSDLTAGILNLAQKGFLEIEKLKERTFLFGPDNYEFRAKVEYDDLKDDLDKLFYSLIFKNEKDPIIDSNLSFLRAGFPWEYDEKGEFRKKVRLSDISERARDVLKIKNRINSWLNSYALDNAIIEKSQNQLFWVVAAFIFAGIFVSASFFPKLTGLLILLEFLSIIVIAVTSYRYTKKGWEIKNNLEGFKKFLSLTEKERMEFFNAPEKNPKEFFEYLPYAIAFGVEKKWAEQFKNTPLDKPEWYKGADNFSVGVFVSELDNLNSEIQSSIATAAASGSGSGGGGFSGGGAGGGGGGSW